jgi:hypothetical protein
MPAIDGKEADIVTMARLPGNAFAAALGRKTVPMAAAGAKADMPQARRNVGK